MAEEVKTELQLVFKSIFEKKYIGEDPEGECIKDVASAIFEKIDDYVSDCDDLEQKVQTLKTQNDELSKVCKDQVEKIEMANKEWSKVCADLTAKVVSLETAVEDAKKKPQHKVTPLKDVPGFGERTPTKDTSEAGHSRKRILEEVDNVSETECVDWHCNVSPQQTSNHQSSKLTQQRKADKDKGDEPLEEGWYSTKTLKLKSYEFRF
jgi:hypothetical protein